jgi:hypothetical protein
VVGLEDLCCTVEDNKNPWLLHQYCIALEAYLKVLVQEMAGGKYTEESEDLLQKILSQVCKGSLIATLALSLRQGDLNARLEKHVMTPLELASNEDAPEADRELARQIAGCIGEVCEITLGPEQVPQAPRLVYSGAPKADSRFPHDKFW